MLELYELQGLIPDVFGEGFSAYKSSLTVSADTTITNWNVASPYFSGSNFNETTGFYSVPKTGVYQTQAVISYSTGTITSQLGANSPTFIIKRTSPAANDLVTGKLPVLDVSILALLTLKTLLSSSTVTLAGTLQLTQGDAIGLLYNANNLTLTLTLQNILWAIYPLG
jgi:hypothetical protein